MVDLADSRCWKGKSKNIIKANCDSAELIKMRGQERDREWAEGSLIKFRIGKYVYIKRVYA